ncbi:MAG: hypothetical protein WDW38_000684 [Sanguina aurantia]
MTKKHSNSTEEHASSKATNATKMAAHKASNSTSSKVIGHKAANSTSHKMMPSAPIVVKSSSGARRSLSATKASNATTVHSAPSTHAKNSTKLASATKPAHKAVNATKSALTPSDHMSSKSKKSNSTLTTSHKTSNGTKNAVPLVKKSSSGAKRSLFALMKNSTATATPSKSSASPSATKNTVSSPASSTKTTSAPSPAQPRSLLPQAQVTHTHSASAPMAMPAGMTAMPAAMPMGMTDPGAITYAIKIFTDLNLTAEYSATPFTIFAPSDMAFEKFAKSVNLTVLDLLKPQYREAAVQVLEYNIVPGMALLSSNISTVPVTVPTAAGPTYLVTVVARDGMVFVSPAGQPAAPNTTAMVLKADVKLGESIVHVTDKVLVPPPA